jgi:hypothetical protein
VSGYGDDDGWIRVDGLACSDEGLFEAFGKGIQGRDSVKGSTISRLCDGYQGSSRR